jgi:hypothetical protein
VNAQDYANDISFPCVFFVCVGCPGGQTIALLNETALPFDLSEIEGDVKDGKLWANNLTSGPGARGWTFYDWNGNTVYKIQVFSDEATWTKQAEEAGEI